MKCIGHVLAVVILLSVFDTLQVEADGIPFWTDDGVVICDTTGNQVDPQLVSDSSGGAIITWSDNDNIYAQRIDAGGSPYWASNGVAICDTTDIQRDPQLVSDGSGGAIISWEDYRNGNYDIYAQRVLANGLVWWDWDGYQICGFTGTQWNPQMASDDSGGAFIVWEDYRGGDYDIYGERVNHWGENEWSTTGLSICDAANQQNSPQIVGDGSGGAIITWYDNRGADYDIYAQLLDARGYEQWTSNGEAICDTTGTQRDPQLVSDGSGGAFIVWEDYRNGNYDIYAQRVDSVGSPQWTSNGMLICDAAGNQTDPQVTGDGFGGAIISWKDIRSGNYDIYAQRVDVDGNFKWTYNGLAICTLAGTQQNPQVTGDGSGGAIIIWEDERDGDEDDDIYAQRVDAYGNTLWAANGVVICDAPLAQSQPQIMGDDSGGAVITWADARNGTASKDIYAQYVLEPEPRIAAIEDIPQDQGRQVMTHWERSVLDQPKFQVITEYTIWRRSPLGSKIESFGQEYDGTLPADLNKRVYRRIERETDSSGAKTEYWEYIGSVDAHFLEGYAYIAPTLEDSSAGGTPYFSFFVSAETADPFVFYDSDPDSGYSVDDIAPAKTQMSVLAAGGSKGPVSTVWLTWDQVTTGTDGSPEQGPIEYRIYCDESPDFTPGPGNLLTSVSGLSYAHTDSRIGDPAANLYYLVTVADGSDNESAVSNRVGEFDKSLSDVK